MYPNLERKFAARALVNPEKFIEYQKSQGKVPEDFVAPVGVIFCFQKSLLKFILETEATVPAHYLHRELYLLEDCDRKIGISTGFGIGAPAATVALEQLIATGSRYFLCIGTAGAISPELKPGDLVLCNSAVRDEGVSHHYLEPSKFAYPSRLLTNNLRDSLGFAGKNFCEGGSWSIDTPFRETSEEVRKYQQEGVLSVEMEAAALFAVSSYRRVRTAAAFSISDSLADLDWSPQFESYKTQAGLEALYSCAKKTLAQIVQPE